MFTPDDGRITLAGHRASPGQFLDIAEFGFSAVQFKNAGVPWASGAIFNKPLQGMKAMQGIPKVQAMPAPIDLAISMGTAERGHMLSAGIGAMGGQVGALAGAAIGSFLGGPLGAAVGAYIGDSALRGPSRRAARNFMGLAGRMNRLEMGGDYEDTQVAYTMRQQAAQQMSTSLLNARQWLGKESALFHQ